MEAFWVSLGVVTSAEIGDKTQLLALLLAARFRCALPIIAGIFVATVLNHAAAAWIGRLIGDGLNPEMLRLILGVSFLAMAVWMLFPDKIDDEQPKNAYRGSAFFTTLILFFLVEIGDKTQLATAALAMRYDALFQVVCGTTAGMLLADAPAVWLSEKMLRRINMNWLHRISAMIFIALAAATLFYPG